MSFAIECYFNERVSKAIDALRDKLITAGVSIDLGTSPHVSQAIYEDLDIEKLQADLNLFARKIGSRIARSVLGLICPGWNKP